MIRQQANTCATTNLRALLRLDVVAGERPEQRLLAALLLVLEHVDDALAHDNVALRFGVATVGALDAVRLSPPGVKRETQLVYEVSRLASAAGVARW